MQEDDRHEGGENQQELIVFTPDELLTITAPHVHDEEEEGAHEVVKANADVLRAAGYSVAGAPHLVLFLSFLDAMINHHPWQPDERILLSLLAAYGLMGAYYWKTRTK